MSEDSITMLERPNQAGSTNDASLASASIATPEQAMQLLEARRAWTYSFGIAILCLVGAIVVGLIGGDPLAQRIHIGALLVTSLLAGIYAVIRRDPKGYRRWEVLAIVFVAMLANLSGFYYWGVYSGFLAAVSASAFAFSSNASTRGVIVATIVCVVLHVGLGVAQLAGWIAQHALFVPGPASTPTIEIVSLVALELILIAAIAGGLDARAKMRTILDEHHAVLRELSQRDALLAEAHAEVREFRANNDGRYSGHQLGRFALGPLLGRGAMGDVYAATDDTGAPCAVKVLVSSLLQNVAALRRFYREAQVIARISSPNIVRMIEVSPAGSEVPYLAMERLEGSDLGEMIKRHPVCELDEVIEIVSAIAAGLDVAHDAGVVHRDLKPANVFAAQSGQTVTWKILDFGVSKVFDGEATMTAGHVVGTPSYMAPEQARGEPIDRRADVYALGVVVYRLLTGRPAVVPGDVPSMLHEVVFRMPPAPSQIGDVSLDIEAVLAIALAKAPDERFATAGQLAAALVAARNAQLPRSVPRRAAAIISRTPWGQWLRRPSDRKRTAAD